MYFPHTSLYGKYVLQPAGSAEGREGAVAIEIMLIVNFFLWFSSIVLQTSIAGAKGQKRVFRKRNADWVQVQGRIGYNTCIKQNGLN